MTLTPPVNAYDPSGADFKESVHRQLRADLSHLGEIRKIGGVITSTVNNGILMDDVTVTIEHPRTRFLFEMKVSLGESGLEYLDMLNSPYIPPFGKGYGPDEANRDAYSTVESVFARLDQHPALTEWSLKHSLGTRLGLAPLGTLAAPSSIGLGADLALALPGSLVSGAAFALGGIGAACVAGSTGLTKMRMDRINAAIDQWNRDTQETLLNSFTSSAVESVFFDVLHSSARRCGIQKVRSVQVTERQRLDWEPVPSTMSLLDKDDTYGADILDDYPFRTFMVKFRGTDSSSMGSKEYYWDGKNFFVHRGVCRVWGDDKSILFFPVGLAIEKAEEEAEEAGAPSPKRRKRVLFPVGERW